MTTPELDLTLEMIERTRQRLLGRSLGYQEALDLMLAIRRLGEDVLHCVNRNQATLRCYSGFHESDEPRQLAVSDTAASGARPDSAEPSGQRSGT